MNLLSTKSKRKSAFPNESPLQVLCLAAGLIDFRSLDLNAPLAPHLHPALRIANFLSWQFTPVERPGIYFITFTCYRWLHLIGQTNAYDAIYNFFSVLNKSGHQVLGYTLMLNYVHLLLFYAGGELTLNTLIGNGKRFIGYEIVKRLQAPNRTTTLLLLQQGVTPPGKNRNKQLWQDTFDVKECRTKKFILQKLNYIQQNPCVEHW